MVIGGINHCHLQHSTSKQVWEHGSNQIVSLVSTHGIVISRETDAALRVLKAAKFNVMDVGAFASTALFSHIGNVNANLVSRPRNRHLPSRSLQALWRHT